VFRAIIDKRLGINYSAPCGCFKGTHLLAAYPRAIAPAQRAARVPGKSKINLSQSKTMPFLKDNATQALRNGALSIEGQKHTAKP